jgi:uncharacterized protein
MKKLISYFIIHSIVYCFSTLAQEIPSMTDPVVDHVGLINKTEKEIINKFLKQLHNNGQGPQFQVLIINNIDNYSIQEYANRVFTKWRIGDAQKDNGLLILVSFDTRKVRIEVGQGLEGSITDINANDTIIKMRPYFRKNNYFKGIVTGLTHLTTLINEDSTDLPKIVQPRSLDSSSLFLVIFIFITVFGALIWLIIFEFNRKKNKMNKTNFNDVYDDSKWGSKNKEKGSSNLLWITGASILSVSSWGGRGGVSSGGGATGSW